MPLEPYNIDLKEQKVVTRNNRRMKSETVTAKISVKKVLKDRKKKGCFGCNNKKYTTQ